MHQTAKIYVGSFSGLGTYKLSYNRVTHSHLSHKLALVLHILISHALMLQMYYLNPVSWTLFGLVASNVGDLDDVFITLSGQTEPTSVPDFLRAQFGYRHDWLGYVVLILIGWIITLWGIGAFAFKRFNFQKR